MLLPAEYYEGDILVDKVLNPCVIDNIDEGLCRHFDYPSIAGFGQVKSTSAITPDGQEPVEFFEDSKVTVGRKGRHKRLETHTGPRFPFSPH